MKTLKNTYHAFVNNGLLFAFALMLISFNGFSLERDIVEVPDLGTLRETGLADGTVYKVTGEIVLTHQNGNRNQKYFQDDSGAILVDDVSGIINTSYEKYDGITDLTGTLYYYMEMLQFVPIEDPGAAVSSGNIIEPLVITLLDLTPAHQAMLVALQGVSFVSPQHEFFQPSTSYNIADPSGQGILRTPHINAALDYFGAPIPGDAIDMIALVYQFQSDMQVFPRSLADMDYEADPDPDPDPDVIYVADIATFKSQDIGSSIVYRITGEVYITHLQRPSRGQFYIQDHSGAILVDDPQGVIETEYNLYDGIAGIKGQLTQFQNMLELLPYEDPGQASSHNNQIEPVELTLADLTEDIQGLLVVVRNVTFDEDNPELWTHNQSYVIYDDSGEGLIRTPNYADLLDYFGDPVPDTPKDIIGVLHQRFDVTRLLPRMAADFMEPVDYELIPGDANCDGVVNVLDIITIANYFIGLYPDLFCFENADVNGDGVINSLDLIGVTNIFTGGGEESEPNTVTDIDGNVYQTVIIGNQEWMAENLRVSRYNNGDTIPTGLDNQQWSETSAGAYAIYDHNAPNTDGINSPEEMVAAYGKLYNWYALVDPRGLCPVGWHVPTDDDWTQLSEYIIDKYYYISDENIGNALKSCSQMNSPINGCATSTHPRWDADSVHYGFNMLGFYAVPGGYRNASGFYNGLGYGGYWQATTSISDQHSWMRIIVSFSGDLKRFQGTKQFGDQVRCVRDLR